MPIPRTSLASAALFLAMAVTPIAIGRPIHHRPAAARPLDVEGLATLPTPVEQALAAARSLATRRDADQFATLTLPAGVEGADFDIRLKPTVLYHDGSLTLMATVTSVYVHDGTFDRGVAYETEHYPAISVRKVTTTRPSYVGENAFGATANVDVFDVKDDAVLVLNGNPDQSELFTTQMDPDRARQVSANVYLEIAGRITRLPDGRVADCKTRFDGATIDDPADMRTDACWVAVRVTQLAYIDGTTGKVLDALGFDAAPITVQTGSPP